MILGAHLDNLDRPADSSFRKLVLMRAGVVGTMWTDGTRHRRPVYERLEAELDRPLYCVRVGPSGKIAPADWMAQARAALAELPPAVLADGRVRVRALNEVNLAAEGGWTPDEYHAFLVELRALRRPAATPIPIVCAPLCLAEEPAWQDWLAGLIRASDGAIPADRIAVNCYAHLIERASFFCGFARPVDVTELNTLDLPPGPERAAWLLATAERFARIGIETVQLFIAGGRSNGAWDERYVLTEEEAALLGAGAAVAAP